MKNKLNNYKIYLANLKLSLVYYNFLIPLSIYLEKNNMQFETLTKEQFAQYFTDQKYTSNSINNVIKSCRNYAKFLGLEKHASLEIKMLQIDRKIPKYITYEELLTGIKHYSTYSNRGMSILKATAILKFLFFTGIRKGELLFLKREKIDLINCSVVIWGEKNKTERIVYYPSHLSKDLINYFNSEEEKINAFNITLAEINHLVKKLGKYINKNISTHTLRHSMGRYAIEKNVSPLILQRILGHASLQTTLIYTNPDNKMIEDIYRKQIG